MKIVIAKLNRLGRDGDKFSKKLIAQIERTRVLIDEEYIEEFNKNYLNSGRLYEIDVEATKERDDKKNKSKSAGRPKKNVSNNE